MTGSIPKRAVTGSRPALHLVFTVVFLVGCGADTDGGASGTEDMFPRADFRFVVEDLGGAPDMRLPVDASVLMDADPMVVDAGTGAFDAGGGAGSEDGSVDMMNPDPPVPPSDPLSEEGRTRMVMVWMMRGSRARVTSCCWTGRMPIRMGMVLRMAWKISTATV